MVDLFSVAPPTPAPAEPVLAPSSDLFDVSAPDLPGTIATTDVTPGGGLLETALVEEAPKVAPEPPKKVEDAFAKYL